MQTLRNIRSLLVSRDAVPRKRLGQCFLIDGNLMAKLLELACCDSGRTVLEVGAGTGSLTEELLACGVRVVAVEIDRRLGEILRDRLGGGSGAGGTNGAENFTLICGDVLCGKHAISPQVLRALGSKASLVSNLPYCIATPLVAECLLLSWRAAVSGKVGECCLFDRLTFTVQREVADRLTARPGSGAYGPVSVLVALLGCVQVGPAVPASAFWPCPKVASRILRIDFEADRAVRLRDADVLSAALRAAFAQRRKQIGSLLKRKDSPFDPDALRDAMRAAGIEPTQRAQDISPEQFATLANELVVCTM